MIDAGSTPVFTYQVTNTGSNALGDIDLVDDAATDAKDDDFAPEAIMIGKFNQGDANRNGLLDPGETWLYTSQGVYSEGVSAGDYVNLARVSGVDQVTQETIWDDDPAHYRVIGVAHTSGRMTGGGSVFTDDGMRVTHGFELYCDPLSGPNNLQVNFDGNSFHLDTVTSMVCYDDPTIEYQPRRAPFDTMIGEGTGSFNNVDGYSVRFTFTDAGEPGYKDFSQIEITDADVNVVLYVAGQLTKGNQQAHPDNKNSSLLLAADGVGTGADAYVLGEADLDDIVVEAKRRWVESGLVDTKTLAALDGISVRVADLDGPILGQANESSATIILDSDAAGWGWFVDVTPQEDSEFALGASFSDVHDHVDLLTVVAHEIGHLLGFAHNDGVMADSLETGIRLLPEGQGEAGIKHDAAGNHQGAAFESADQLGVARLLVSDSAMSVNYLSPAERSSGEKIEQAEESKAYLFDEVTGGFEDMERTGVSQESFGSGEECIDDWVFDQDAVYPSGGLRQNDRPLIVWNV